MAIYQRPLITMKTIELLKQQTHPLFKIVLVGSTNLDKTTAIKTGVDFLQYENKPLSNKWQAGIEYARQFDPDAILINGSDSWLSTNWCSVTKKYIEKGFDMVGKTQFYSCRLDPGQTIMVISKEYKYRKDPVGAGRLISKKILDKMQWKLFPKGYNSSLDGESYKKLVGHKANIKILNNQDEIIVMGVKANTWPALNRFNASVQNRRGMFNRIQKLKEPRKWLKDNFPNAEKDFPLLINNLVW
jgi:hypothetical protein